MLAFLSLGTWWAIPAFAVFGTLWGGSADARWHESGHGTAFRSPGRTMSCTTSPRS